MREGGEEGKEGKLGTNLFEGYQIFDTSYFCNIQLKVNEEKKYMEVMKHDDMMLHYQH